MRTLLSVLLVLSGPVLATAQTAAPAPATLEWKADGKTLRYGGPGDQVVLQAECGRGPGFDLSLRLPGAYPGPWQDGQSMEVSASSGVVPLANLSGAIEESEDETFWLFRTRVGVNHPLLARLFAGQSIQINAGRDGYRVDPRDGRAALLAFRDACRRGE